MSDKVIIVTTDFSEHARAAYAEAEKEAKGRGAAIALVTVITGFTVPVDFTGGEQGDLIERLRKDLSDKAAKALSEERKRFTAAQVKTEVLVSLVQSVADTVCDYAKKNNGEMIVISSQGENALTQFVLGSVVHKIVKHAPCPVLVVPVKR